MSHIESWKVRQENELEVLKSIFGEELHDLRKNTNRKKWHPLDITITLTPSKGMSGPAQVHAQIDLHVTCGEKYPDEVPFIQLKNSRGLSNQQVAVLISELKESSKQLKGEVMIFELSQHVEKFLHEHNKPGFSSFYEEMVSRQQEKIQCEIQTKKLKEDKERQLLQDEIEKRQEALKAEIRNRKESLRQFNETDTNSQTRERARTNSRHRTRSRSESSDISLCEHRGTRIIQFDDKNEKQVHIGRCLGHNSRGSIVFAGVDLISGELIVVTEWTLKHTQEQVMKQIASLEQEIHQLYRLHHSNLVHYLNMKYLQEDNCIKIYTLQEFVVGTTCSFFLRENIPVDTDLLRHLATGILSGLQYLHENNVVHRDLRETSVHLDRMGNVRISDYALDKRLYDIYSTNALAKIEQDFPTVQGRSGKKADVYRFGLLLLSLSKGHLICGNEIDLTVISQPQLKDFISKCLILDERTRWSSDQLRQHLFIRTPLERSLSVSRCNSDKERKNSEPEQPETDIQLYFPKLGGQSRIENEFEILKWLGKGAFGDVLKVRNKLDGGIYAIKRIKLNPKNKLLNKKITREVKLLSRMNHENVVRYYNSWIESANLDNHFTSESITTQLGTSVKPNSRETLPGWSISYESRASAAVQSDSEDDNSDSDSEDDSSFFIEFERDGSSPTSTNTSETSKNRQKNEPNDDNITTTKEIQFMYIQMEFCEKSTLRTAIDNGLYKDEERVWRLFREIVEGLAHIHQQGMIHRDLKPVNIFLDSNDHVKIGDFGLATTNILSSLAQTVETDKEIQSIEKGGSYDIEELGSLTGQVGTALYVAPELSAKAVKAIYNQKVDIYSLGIILFEMCYPLSTHMERVKILLNVRLKDIILPSEITETYLPHQVHLLRWILNHDPSQRPTAQELLSSEYLPPPQLEETEFQEMVRYTLSNTRSKAYKYLVAGCFMQQVTPAENITYDMHIPTREKPTNLLFPKIQYLKDGLKTKVMEIFQRHGGINLTTPLLMPKSGGFYNYTDSCVKLMTCTGTVISIPHDLRAPFARYVVWNKIPHARRYAIERVFREKKVRGFHPRELYECAFDIVSPIENNLMMEAEMIFIAWEIFNEIPQLKDRNVTIRINHTSLLQSIFLYCGIEKEKHQDVYSILYDARDGKVSKFQIHTHLISLCLTDQAVDTLFNLLETESSVAKISSVLKTITKRRGEVAELAKQGFQDIERVISYVEALGVKYPVMIVPLLVHNVEQHSGILFQITCEMKPRRKRGGQDVIAAGGRYDKMLMSLQKTLERTNLTSKEIKQHGVGISISLDKLVDVVHELSENLNGDDKSGIDVAVCYECNSKRDKEMLDVLRELWSLGMKVTILDLFRTEEILEYCQENGINQIVVLKSGEKGWSRVLTWEKDRFQERKINITDIGDYMSRQTETPLIILNRSESKIITNDGLMYSSNPINVNINFIPTERDKLSGSSRRSLKNTMLAQMSSYLQRISPKVPIEIFAIFLEMPVVRTIISFLEIDEEEQDFHKTINAIIEKHPRHKKYIKEICEEMKETRNEKSKPVLVLYSLTDNGYMSLI